MKFPIAWHEECLKNKRRSLAEDERRLASIDADVARTRTQIEHYAAQIELAKEKKKAGFDREKFGLSLKKPPAPTDAHLWWAFARALDEGRISVILEGGRDSIDGGLIVTEIDEVVEHITKKGGADG